MSNLRGRSDVVAILCSDIHLSHKPPAYRSVEEDWYKAMSRPLKQLNALSVEHDAPVIIAGDIFDRWNSPAELVNFAIRNLPLRTYAIPGQHDLAYHSYSDIKKTSYWTLVEAGAIKDIPWACPVDIPGRVPIRLHGFPWGFPVGPLENHSNLAIEIAVVHSYIWKSGCNHPNAKEDSHVDNYSLRRYDAAVFGDNHIPFILKKGEGKLRCNLVNCGTFMIRKSDDVKRPCVYLLHDDASISPYELDVSKNKYLDAKLVKNKHDVDFSQFMDELNELGDKAINFIETMRRFLDQDSEIPKQVRNLILSCMEKDEP